MNQVSLELLHRFPLGTAPRHHLRAGIVGLGGIARHAHLPALETLIALGWPIDVTWLCDRENTRLEAAAALFPQARRIVDWTALPVDELEAVLLFVPPGLALEITEHFAARGIATLVEKPVALTVSALDAARTRLGTDAQHVQVGYNRRFQPLRAATARALAALEGVSTVDVTIWRGARTRGDFYEDVPVHAFDLLRAQLGELSFRGCVAAPAPAGQISPHVEVSLLGPRSESIRLDIRPAAGKVEEIYTYASATSRVALSYPVLDGARRVAPAALTFSRHEHTEAIARFDLEAIVAADATFLRGFVHQLAAFFHLASQRSGRTPACTLDDAAAALRFSSELSHHLA